MTILGRLEKKIQKGDLLTLDEMGYVSFDRYQSELLFKIIADRSERGSIIITTNLQQNIIYLDLVIKHNKS